eukprot:XP_028337709.1 cytochrome c oxidase assembly factor 6 homolog isoform X2 [Physeter catodon]
MAAPSMKERQACWGARDEYWKCLDENPEDAAQCKKLRSSLESSCPRQWIKSKRNQKEKYISNLKKWDISRTQSLTKKTTGKNGKLQHTFQNCFHATDTNTGIMLHTKVKLCTQFQMTCV